MKEKVIDFIEKFPIISGLIIMLIGLLLLHYQLDKKNTFNMDDYNLFSWKTLVNMWAIIILFIFGGLIMVLINL